jgi:hypothetical protein
MKRIIFFYLILMAFISCVDFYSKEEKIENGIKKYLSIGMNDFKSYEPVKFGRLDSIYDHTYYPSQNGTYGIQLLRAIEYSIVLGEKIILAQLYLTKIIFILTRCLMLLR